MSELLKEPYNPFDPVVVFDPTFEEKIVIKRFDNIDEKTSTQSSTQSKIKDDAINIPIIRLNNITLNDGQIDFMELYFTEFVPKIHLSIKDNENYIRTLDTPGFDNEIIVIMTTEINGYYKKIKLQFYITEFKIFDEYISYHGVYNIKELNNVIFKQLGNKKLSTYEMLEMIAKETKLGFAASNDCKEIKDEKYRIIRSENYTNFINEQMKFAGVDEKSIFDCWIDIYGYIVLMNVYRAMNEKVEQNQLMINSMVGLYSSTSGNNNIEAVKLQRTLTNNIMNDTNYNLLFKNYKQIINNNSIYNDGALNQLYYMSSPGKDNLISVNEIQAMENSDNGVEFSQEYEFKKTKFIGIEFEEEDVLLKKNINNKFFDKIKTKKIEIELENYNLGLERGTLVNVIFKEYNPQIISSLTTDKENTPNDTEGVINQFASGMYYIDGIKFLYKTEDHKIKQFLYLIKRDSVTNPINKSNEPLTVSQNEQE